MISLLLVTNKAPDLAATAPFDSLWVEEIEGFFAVLGRLPSGFLSIKNKEMPVSKSPNAGAPGETSSAEVESEGQRAQGKGQDEGLASEHARLISALRAHHAIARACFQQEQLVLPIRFGAGFSSHASALAHIKSVSAQLADALAQVGDCAEWRMDCVVETLDDDEAIGTLPYLKRKAALREQKLLAGRIAEDFQRAISDHLRQHSDRAFRFTTHDVPNSLGRLEFLLPRGSAGETRVSALEQFIENQVNTGRFPRTLKCDLHGPSPVFSFAESFLADGIEQMNDPLGLAPKSTQGEGNQDVCQ